MEHREVVQSSNLSEICQISYGIVNNWAIATANSLLIVLSALGT